MRQAGVLAAAGIVALKEQVGRLPEDHANARRLAERVAGVPGLEANPERVPTNILIFEVRSGVIDAPALIERWKAKGVLALALDERRVRAVTHYDVDREGIETAADRLQEIMTTAG